MAGTSVLDTATWRTLQQVHVNDAGTWRPCLGIYVNDAGTWRQVFFGALSVQVPLTGYTYQNPAAGTAQLQFNSDGWIYATSDGTGALIQQTKWLLQGTAAQAEIMSNNNAGSWLSDPSAGSWLNLGTSRLWTKTASAGTSSSVTSTFHIRNAATLVELASNDISLTRDRI